MGTVFRKIIEGIDVKPISQALTERAEVWDHIRARQETPGSPHSMTKTIFLRWSPTRTVEAALNEVEAVDYPDLQKFPEAEALIDQFYVGMQPTKLGRVIITQLIPFGYIEPHVDEGAYPDHYQRFHIPISCGSNAKFYGRTEDVIEMAKMQPGSLWWFDNKREHWVENMCNVPRVHMIFDAVVPGFERPYDRRLGAT